MPGKRAAGRRPRWGDGGTAGRRAREGLRGNVVRALSPPDGANGRETGVTWDLDVARSHPGVRIFPLERFPPVRVVRLGCARGRRSCGPFGASSPRSRRRGRRRPARRAGNGQEPAETGRLSRAQKEKETFTCSRCEGAPGISTRSICFPNSAEAER